jgi:tubulin--tyrosine ligase-like protein 12
MQAWGSPEWLQPTYNLETHLSPLIGDYFVRKRDGMYNLWIMKPWNMARTIDTTVTGDLSAIIRLMETGPKICQKYIERPALFQGSLIFGTLFWSVVSALWKYFYLMFSGYDVKF